MPFELSDDQRLLAGWDTGTSGDLFAEACPGAGKTRAIVARHLRLTGEEPRKGIALVSFTTAAIDEITRRCGDRPDAVRAPHFVGTFDAFINRYLTKPLYIAQYGLTPRFLDSWDRVKRASFRPPSADRLPDVELNWFTFDGSLQASLVEDWIPPRYPYVRQALAAQRTAVEQRATKVCRSLVARGLISSAASRALTVGYLESPETAERFGRLLANRFSEVIVDEAQDCGPEELHVLKLLRRFGVKLVAVADLDQSIFAFRRVEPAELRAFTDKFAGHLALKGNYRSSPAICGLNNSLRSGNLQEVASGPNATCPTPVCLMEFSSPDTVVTTIRGILDGHDLSRGDVVFLAHRRTDAQRCAGQRLDDATRSTSAVLGIASAHAVLTDGGSTAKERLSAVQRVEATLQEIAGIEDIDLLGERWLRDTAVRLAVSLDPAGLDPKSYAAQVREYVQHVVWPAGITPTSNLGATLRAPQAAVWSAPGGDDGSSAFASATIHSAKGREFPGVIVVLPKHLVADAAGRHALDYWEQQMDSELTRVLYVGASRAQRLLILAVHSDHRNRVASLLDRDSVRYDRIR